MSFDQPMEELYCTKEHMSSGLCDENSGNSVFYQDLKQENIDMLNQASNGFGFAEPQFQQSDFQQQHQHNQGQYYGLADNTANFAQLHQFGTSDYLNQSISSHSSPSMNGFESGPIKYSAISPESIDDKSQNQQQQQQQLQQQQQQTNSKKATQNKRHLLDEQDAILLAREDSELNEEELLAKKKAQNRAAQRAFRERKESKFKDLEAKLNKSEVEKQKLLDQLTYFRSQNEYQRQQEEKRMNTASITPDAMEDKVIHAQFTFPRNQESFINEMTQGHPLTETSDTSKVYDAPEYPDTKLLAVGAVWDYLHMRAEELERDDQYFDVVEIMAKLKGNEKCHGYGPAYPLDVVNRAIQESLR